MPNDRNDTPTAAAADVPQMPAPRVREVAAHSIGGGLALLLGLVGLLVGAGMVAGATAVTGNGGKAALIIGASWSRSPRCSRCPG